MLKGITEKVLNSITEGVIIINKSRLVEFMNPAAEALTGWKQEEACGKDMIEIFNIISKETGSLIKSHNARLLWESITRGIGMGVSKEEALIRKDDVKIIVDCNASLLKDDNGVMNGVILIFRNVTEQRQTEDIKARLQQQQLIHADKMISLGTLVSGIAHEINNPNNFIMLNAPLLHDVWKDVVPIIEEYYKKHGDFNMGGLKYSEMHGYIPQLFAGIIDGAKRIKRIVTDLKDFARQDSSDMDQSVDVNLVVKSAITLVSAQIRKATNKFMVDYGVDIPTIKGSFHRIEQVIINLLLNACQALPSPKNGILVSTSYARQKNVIEIKVMDEGIGIPSVLLPHITDPFFTTKRDSGGTGLGLSVSEGIIKDHRGELGFFSVEGKGTTVTVTLPVRS